MTPDGLYEATKVAGDTTVLYLGRDDETLRLPEITGTQVSHYHNPAEGRWYHPQPWLLKVSYLVVLIYIYNCFSSS